MGDILLKVPVTRKCYPNGEQHIIHIYLYDLASPRCSRTTEHEAILTVNKNDQNMVRRCVRVLQKLAVADLYRMFLKPTIEGKWNLCIDRDCGWLGRGAYYCGMLHAEQRRWLLISAERRAKRRRKREPQATHG